MLPQTGFSGSKIRPTASVCRIKALAPQTPPCFVEVFRVSCPRAFSPTVSTILPHRYPDDTVPQSPQKMQQLVLSVPAASLF